MVDNDFGEYLRETRRKKKLTAEKLAKSIGVDRTYISKIERAGYFPSYGVLHKIAKEIGDPHLLELFLIHGVPHGTKTVLEEKSLPSLGYLILLWLETDYTDEAIASIIRKTYSFSRIPSKKDLLKAVGEFRSALKSLSAPTTKAT